MLTTATLKKDIPASIVVFLVALPLCLGVALASGAPLIAGIISGVVGGILVGLISQSQTSVSGPAAGLSAVILSAITRLETFDIFLISVVIAGAIQLTIGLLKAGVIASYIPSSVIKGLLAAIGVLLILKQIPHAIGYDKDPEDDFAFIQADGENTFTEILKAFNYITPGAIIISIASMLLLLYWDRTPLSRFKLLPAPLFVVLTGIALNFFFTHFIPYLGVEPSHLVNIPSLADQHVSTLIHIPDLSYLLHYPVWVAGFTIAIVASLETLLNIEAVDKLDPKKRKTPPNRELIAQGIGNMTAGLLGGIPVTSVIVRSSINIQSGNETKLSSVLHGVFMLTSVLVLAPVLNHIPLSTLAAILIITGYKLTNVTLIRQMYQKGMSEFAPFIVTIGAIVFTDLLVGVLIGLGVSIFFLMRSNFRNPFVREKSKLHVGEVIRIELPHQVSFLNRVMIREALWQVPRGGKVIIDATHADFIDNDILELIDDFRKVVAPEKNIRLNIVGSRDQQHLPDQVQFINVIDKETQNKMTPEEVLGLLKSGNERFISGKSTDKYYRQQVDATSHGQNPMAVIVACIDSRTSPEITFDAGLGDLLTIRIAGNIISPEIIGSLEIAVGKLGAKLIVVKGHSHCGAVGLAMAGVPGHDHQMGTVTRKIQKAIDQCGHTHGQTQAQDHALVEKITRQNVHNSIEEILAGSPYLMERLQKKEIGMVGAYHDIKTSRVEFGEMR